MSTQQSQTITIVPPSDLAPGESHYFDLGSSKPDTPAGTPAVPKKGYLAKVGPFDGVVFDSYHPERIRGSADGMNAPVPQDSARTLDGNPVGNYVKVTNPSSNANTLAKENIEVILFGRADASREANKLQFSGSAIISDLVPGVTTDG
jgi:hypothetical protein